MTADNIRNVGVIGAGSMGGALAESLLAEGFGVSVWNRTPEKLVPFAALNAFTSTDLNSVIERSELIVVSISDYASTEKLLFADGPREALRGKILVQLTTITRSESEKMAALCQLDDILYLDGAIMGLPQRVRDGDCIIAYSGPRGVYAYCEQVLLALGKKPMFISESYGAAPDLELARFAYIYGSWLAYFQALAFCSAGGLPLDVIVEIIDNGEHIRNRTTKRYGDAIIQRDYTAPGATIDVHATAFKLVSEQANSLDMRTDLIQLLGGLFDEAKAKGYGQKQLPALFEIMVEGTRRA
ncbi:NAD(P)-dependent oxidoreductase [Phyllobacterium zundukense]|uniref:NAD(P)-binding domain-containing protein n=1 Tax=Phyllobacterium zundukense TaxID=1867719 RepID=A0ACD4CVN8_9HYPH|nr:NAD(P)-binding domain-containing protein [Phyllobacterium zundukense]UXN57557.1 NAD(P)-binding domain-containing protein [Phyllobacterium zundukense]